MSGNGRGAQRPQSRPPFLVIGLLVALGILGFNYWNLSSANVTLSATNIDLQDQIRILTSKRLNEEQSKKHVEKKYGLLEQRIAAKDSEIKGLLDDVEIKKVAQEKAEHVVNECNTNLQACETNISGMQQQLAAVNSQLEEFKKKQDQPQNCDSQCKEQTKKLYSAMFDKVGAQVMQHIINTGVDVGDDLKIQVQQAASNAKQIKPPNQNTEQQKKTEDGQQDAQGKGSTSPTDGMINSLVGLKDRLKQGVVSLSQKGPLHDIINQTQEGIKMGMQKSQEIAGLIYGGDGNKTHDSSNITQDINVEQKSQNYLKTDTLVGNKNAIQPETKKNDANPKTDDKNKEGDTQKTGDVSKVDDKNKEIKGGNNTQDGKTVITVTGAPRLKPLQDLDQQADKDGKPVKDDGYEDDDPEEGDNENGNDQVEGNRNLKFMPQPKDKKLDEDSIDALRKRLNN